MMTNRFLRYVAAGVFAMLLSAPALIAQTVTGSITGSVTDPSGAVVPSAQVVAHNLDTGVDTPTTTNNDGFYRIQFLPIGRYQVTVQATGFSQVTLPPFTLEVLQTPTFNVKLQVGSAATTVNVSAAAPILNTNDPIHRDHIHVEHDSQLSAEWPRLLRADSLCAGRGGHGGNLGNDEHRAQHVLHRHAQYEWQPGAIEQLHARRHRHERDIQ